jgi:hypothetical protein
MSSGRDEGVEGTIEGLKGKPRRLRGDCPGTAVWRAKAKRNRRRPALSARRRTRRPKRKSLEPRRHGTKPSNEGISGNQGPWGSAYLTENRLSPWPTPGLPPGRRGDPRTGSMNSRK